MLTVLIFKDTFKYKMLKMRVFIYTHCRFLYNNQLNQTLLNINDETMNKSVH